MSNLNLGGWVRRLLFDRDDEPQVAYNAQPVIVLADHSGLTPRFEGPSMFIGGSTPASAGEHPAFTIRAMSPGGFLVRSFHVTAIGAAAFGVVSQDEVWGLAGPIALDVDMVMQPGTTTTGAMGTVAPGNIQLAPLVEYPYITGGPLDMNAHFWVPNGKYLIVEGVTVSQAISMWANIEELPAAKGL